MLTDLRYFQTQVAGTRFNMYTVDSLSDVVSFYDNGKLTFNRDLLFDELLGLEAGKVTFRDFKRVQKFCVDDTSWRRKRKIYRESTCGPYSERDEWIDFLFPLSIHEKAKNGRAVKGAAAFVKEFTLESSLAAWIEMVAYAGLFQTESTFAARVLWSFYVWRDTGKWRVLEYVNIRTRNGRRSPEMIDKGELKRGGTKRTKRKSKEYRASGWRTSESGTMSTLGMSITSATVSTRDFAEYVIESASSASSIADSIDSAFVE